MNTKWNLNDIYFSIDSNEFINDYNAYPQQISSLNTWTNDNLTDTDNTPKKLEEYIILKNRLAYYDKLFLYLNLLLSTDTTNQKAIKQLDKLENIAADATYHETLFMSFIKSINNLDEIIPQSAVLQAHSYYLQEQKKYSQYLLSPSEENIISKLKTTGSMLWQKQWEQLSSTLSVDINIDGEDKTLPLSEIRNYAYSSDGELRKNAYEAELKAYKKIDRSCAYSLNGIKGEVITISNLRSYPSPLEQTVIDSRMDMEILNTMWSAIRDKIPEIQPYFLAKSKLLGHTGSLPFYDLFAPVGNADITFTPEQAKDFIVQNFTDFSPQLGDFAKQAFENSWIDLMPHKGKVGGAFCEAIHPIKQSRILTNFGGTFNDVITLAHELGHAYHDTRLYNETPLNSFYPMPIAETASTLCETIVINAALKTASQDEALVILENDIQGATQVVIDIYSRFLFEDKLFNERKNGSLSSEELQEFMLEAQKQAYGTGLDHNYLHPYMWICKPHYYDADFNYYNFPYAFGLLLAKGLYSKYQQEGNSFIALYDNLLTATGTHNLYEVARIAGIDLYSKDFWFNSLDIIIEEINKFISLSQ